MATKIRIVGSVGSGKTTLARKLALQKGISMYSLDDVVWSRSTIGDCRNSEELRDAKLQAILSEPSWIIEGAHLGWSLKTFEEADQIFFLHPSLPVRIYRISRRFLQQKRGIEHASYTPTWKMYSRMFKWTYQYETIYKKQVRAILKNSKNAIEIRDGSELGV
ncbi:P-loop NTPase family protein [Paenisporosarcina antarctica]|uniref:DNA topology modulation protein FlaR n=1 Tax=Paenisporosarcina antarctica TaxID=417367 RepID=A0A4P6ZUQ4_9BACL|nr:DNA topology modulation protein FlaR [Paenisporosarcina antarctica]QBP39943.1 DNA topology modulation protein FlaR [Paenisporosarcina antarctica]